MRQKKQTPSDDSHHQPVTVKEIMKRTGVERETRTLAVRGLPSAREATLSTSEAETTEIVEHRITKRRQEIEKEAQAVWQQLSEVSDPGTDRTLVLLAGRVLSEIMKVFFAYASQIRDLVRAEREAKAEYEAFREEWKNVLKGRSPIYPLSRLHHFAVVVFLALVEALANSLMFLNATSAGLLGAFVCAVLVTVCNVGVAVLAGLLPVRYMNLPFRWVKAWAIPALTVCVVAVLWTNLLAAHFREVANTTGGAFTEASVLHHLLEHPTDLSLQSLGLCVLGLLFSGLAAWKGHTASDSFPGFEAPHRRWTEKLEDLEYLKQQIHGALTAIYKSEIVYAADKPYVASGLIEAIHKAHKALLLKQSRYDALDASDMAVGTLAIERFRALNLSIRTDGVLPAYFSKPPVFTNIPARPVVESLGQAIEELERVHREHIEKYLSVIALAEEQVERAKDNTDRIMAAITKSYVDETAMPQLGNIREFIERKILQGAQPCIAVGEKNASALIAAE